MINGKPLVNLSALPDEIVPAVTDTFSSLVTIFKAVGIVLLIYIIFLILKTLFTWKTVSKIRNIAKNVEQINKKLDVLIKRQENRKIKKKK